MQPSSDTDLKVQVGFLMKAMFLFLAVLLSVPFFEGEAQARGFFTRGPIRRFIFLGGPIRRRLFARRLARRACRRCGLPPRFARPPRCGNGPHGRCNPNNVRPFSEDVIDPAQNGAGITGGLSPVSQVSPDQRSEFEKIFDEAEQPKPQDLSAHNWRALCESSSGRKQLVGPITLPSDLEENFEERALLHQASGQKFFFRLDEETGKLAVKIGTDSRRQEKTFCVLQ